MKQDLPQAPILLQTPQTNDTVTLVEAAGLLWKKKFLLIICSLVGGAIGLLISNWIRPQYQSDALLQIDLKGSNAGKAMGEMGALLDVGSPADAEIELIKSRMVANDVVEQEHLCFNATPVGAIKRLMHKEGRMDIDDMNIPESSRSEQWLAEIIDDSTYAVYSPERQKLIQGKIGEVAGAPYGRDSLKILVALLQGLPGQKFILSQTNPLDAARTLIKNLNVAEKGKQTGIIGVSYTHRYADRAAHILNTLAMAYLRQNVEMKSAEAAKTLEFLQLQLPGVKAKLDSAEEVLTTYRHRIGSVDMTGETQAHLEKETDLQKQLLVLEQQRQEAARLFKEGHPAIETIVKQKEKVQSELAKLKTDGAKMPLTQQEVFRLQEEVAVNNEQYTSMLNNIQQLRVVRAGEVGNVRIVDYAQIEDIPSKPKKTNILLCAVAASLMIGVLFVFLMRMLKSGVRNTLEIERETGVSVFAKIPEIQKGLLSNKKQQKPIVIEKPYEPASESLRSLFTALDFALNGKKVILVTGMVPGVGKSFVAKNLSALYAESGKKTLLIDADMRKGTIHGHKRHGLSNILSEQCGFSDAISKSNTPNLTILGAGSNNVSPSELLRSEAFGKMLESAKQEFDIILIDTPPLELVTDTEVIIPLADFVLFVLHYGRHSMNSIKESINKINRQGEKQIAFAMNRYEHESSGYYYGGYGYGYGSKYYGKKK
ncbi:MAG: polysaccharide biosynthesis tyrosine autokinase [Fibrobacteraceae bacterium]|nr:polysaccharide biosynthesis tyrosine autokinase [Fibrobacteraceae bacterium]